MALRRTRIFVALITFCLFLSVFLGSIEVTTKLSDKILFFQFVPSLINFLLATGGLASTGFILIVLLSLIFGRIYCSTLCPLGILQDIMISGYQMLSKRKPQFQYQKPHHIIRYSILILTLMVSILGSLVIINLLDPYSLFGKIVSHLGKPVYYYASNSLVSVLEHFDVYALGPKKILPTPFTVLSVSFCFFALITFMAIRYGRMYCTLICPVGTLLGIISRFSLFRFKINADNCKNCTRCVQTCKSGCIDISNKTIEQDRCISCFNCLKVCKKSGITYEADLNKTPAQSLDLDKRKLIVGTATSGIFMLTLGLPLRSYSQKIIKKKENSPAIPPGSLNISHFTRTCIGCNLCIHSCRSKVLKPAFMEYGITGILQPVMDFNQGKCAYECNACGKVCPTNAITCLDLAQKKMTKIGSVKLLKELCITHKKHQDCGACIEVCPTHAVYTVLKNNVRYPEITPGPCIGCGACQLVCPVKPEKAIIVKGISTHSIAEKPFYTTDPQIKNLSSDSDKEFPF